MLAETLERVFEGSTTALVAHLLDDARPSAEELKEIRKLIESYAKSERKPKDSN
jgi:predicted transcriptional regulator